MGQDAQAIREEIEATRSRMGETAEAIAYRADIKARTKERISDKVNNTRSKLGLAGSQVAAAAPSATDVRQGAQKAVGIAQENPLGLAIGSVAVGFIAGLFVPITRVENERLGPIADEIKEQVMQTGQEALEHGREVAQDAVAGAADAAQQSSEEHVEALKASAQESVEQVKDAART